MKHPGKVLAYLMVTALVAALCWSLAADYHYAQGYAAGIHSVRTPLIEEGRLRWIETDRDTLASGLVIYEVRDMVWNERCLVLVRDGEPIFAVVIEPR